MTKLSYTLGMKVFACFIAVLSGITAFFDGIGIFLANSYDFYSSSLAELKLAHPYLDTGMLTLRNARLTSADSGDQPASVCHLGDLSSVRGRASAGYG